ESIAEVQSNIDGLFDGVATLGESLQRAECPLERCRRLPVCRPVEGLGSRLAKVLDGSLPHLAAQSMVTEAFDMLGETVGVEPFDRVDDPRVQRSSSFLEKRAVRHLVCERVLERVFEFGEETRLVKEFGGLEVREGTTKLVLRDLGDRLEE